jgi:hypothetical protein
MSWQPILNCSLLRRYEVQWLIPVVRAGRGLAQYFRLILADDLQ